MSSDFVTAPYRFDVVTGVDHWVPEKGADAFDTLLLDQLSQIAP